MILLYHRQKSLILDDFSKSGTSSSGHRLVDGVERQLNSSLDFGNLNYSTEEGDWKTFSEGSFIVHEASREDGKIFRCTACDYRCKQRGHITQHVRIHTGQKPFKCLFCDARSCRRANINKHMKQQHASMLSMLPLVNQSVYDHDQH